MLDWNASVNSNDNGAQTNNWIVWRRARACNVIKLRTDVDGRLLLIHATDNLFFLFLPKIVFRSSLCLFCKIICAHSGLRTKPSKYVYLFTYALENNRELLCVRACSSRNADSLKSMRLTIPINWIASTSAFSFFSSFATNTIRMSIVHKLSEISKKLGSCFHCLRTCFVYLVFSEQQGSHSLLMQWKQKPADEGKKTPWRKSRNGMRSQRETEPAARPDDWRCSPCNWPSRLINRHITLELYSIERVIVAQEFRQDKLKCKRFVRHRIGVWLRWVYVLLIAALEASASIKMKWIEFSGKDFISFEVKKINKMRRHLDTRQTTNNSSESTKSNKKKTQLRFDRFLG